MKKKRYLVIIIVLLAFVSVLLTMCSCSKKKMWEDSEETESNTVYVNPFDVNNVTYFSYTLDGEAMSFSLEDGEWIYYGDTSIEVNANAVQDFLAEITGITATSIYANVEDGSKYGMDDPSQTLTVVLANGQSMTYYFGDETVWNYTLTDETYALLESLDQDVIIYVMNTEDNEDHLVSKTLECYEEASSHITVEYIGTRVESEDIYVTYTNTDPSDGSLIVVSGDYS